MRCWTRGPALCFPSWRWSTPRRGRDRDTGGFGPPTADVRRGAGGAGAAGDAPLASTTGPVRRLPDRPARSGA